MSSVIDNNGTKVLDMRTATIDDCRAFVHDLIYTNYKHNRQHTPSMTPEQWKVIYGDSVPLLERRYQAELSREHN